LEENQIGSKGQAAEDEDYQAEHKVYNYEEDLELEEDVGVSDDSFIVDFEVEDGSSDDDKEHLGGLEGDDLFKGKEVDDKEEDLSYYQSNVKGSTGCWRRRLDSTRRSRSSVLTHRPTLTLGGVVLVERRPILDIVAVAKW
jgi:hypothetical protein